MELLIYAFGFAGGVTVEFAMVRAVERADQATSRARFIRAVLLASASVIVPALVMTWMRGTTGAGAYTLLGIGGVMLGFGSAAHRHPFRGVGSIVFGLGVGALGAQGSVVVTAAAAKSTASNWAPTLV